MTYIMTFATCHLGIALGTINDLAASVARDRRVPHESRPMISLRIYVHPYFDLVTEHMVRCHTLPP